MGLRRLGSAALGLLLACGDDATTANDEGSSGVASTSGTTSSSSGTSTSSSSSGESTSSGDDTSGSESTGDPWVPPPECGSLHYDWSALVPGPAEPGFDDALEVVARRHDRMHTVVNGLPLGMAADIDVAVDDTAGRAALQAFADDDAAWSFANTTDVVTGWGKATGAYAGVAAAADAYRYGTLRDQGYPCQEIDRAREQLVRVLDGLHLATALTGTPGLVVRAYAHREFPGAGQSETTPLFDGDGNPQPPEKTNGTWRDDVSGAHPELVWEDACSCDQLVGWAAGYGAAWEVIEHDPTIDQALKDRLQADASAIARQLMTVRESGYDLEVMDADGRITMHGYLHENNIEGQYLGVWNGFHALMAAGIVGALAYVADDDEIDAYLYDQLLGQRNLMGIAVAAMFIDFGAGSNYSNYNMAFDAAWLASRYLDHAQAREDLRSVVRDLYASEGASRQPIENAQSFFDFVYAATIADASAFAPTADVPDEAATERGLSTLARFPVSPAWDFAVENCDADEIAAGVCTLINGDVTDLLGDVGWNDELVAADPVPIKIRPPSNFYWRSNPYAVNGGGVGQQLASAADFRFAYWLGRWTRR